MGLFFVACSQSIPSLEKRVTGFWTALGERDRVAAQNFVAPSLRNNFLRQRERRYRSWKILEIEEQSDKRSVVRIGYEGFFEQLQSYQELTESQTWEIIDGEWFLNVDPPEERLRRAIKKIYSSEETTRWETEKDGRVTVNSQIRIPFFNSAQFGTLMIRNGTEKSIRIVEVFLDENLFKISENLYKLYVYLSCFIYRFSLAPTHSLYRISLQDTSAFCRQQRGRAFASLLQLFLNYLMH